MNVDEVILLMEAVNKNNIGKLSLQTEGGEKITIRGKGKAVFRTAEGPGVMETAEEDRQGASVGALSSDRIVTSPLVGTFYASSSPEAEAFVKAGDTVKKGQVLGIIEAMKLMNEIESEYDGVIAEVLVKNEEVVEFGQPLFRIR